MECGREPGGSNADELGVCPACVATEADGINYGKNAGRVCWAIAGTYCEGKVQGSFARKRKTCMDCEVYKKVKKEEKEKFKLLLFE